MKLKVFFSITILVSVLSFIMYNNYMKYKKDNEQFIFSTAERVDDYLLKCLNDNKIMYELNDSNDFLIKKGDNLDAVVYCS